MAVGYRVGQDRRISVLQGEMVYFFNDELGKNTAKKVVHQVKWEIGE